MSNHLRIAVLGTGLMGAPMARRLCEAGHLVTVWNRTPAKAEPLVAAGAQWASTAQLAVAKAQVVLTMLENGRVVRELLDRVLPALPPQSIWLDMSSIKPSEAREHARLLAQHQIIAIDAPVSGGTVGAQAGTLAIMAGGDAQAIETLTPLFAVLGRATHVGPAGAGQLAKLANQTIVGISIGAVAEALLLARQGGADMAQVREAIRGGFAESRVLDLHGQRMVDGDFAKRAALAVQLKDMRNALETARECGLTLPITALLEQLYASAVTHGLGELDHSGLFLELAGDEASENRHTP